MDSLQNALVKGWSSMWFWKPVHGYNPTKYLLDCVEETICRVSLRHTQGSNSIGMAFTATQRPLYLWDCACRSNLELPYMQKGLPPPTSCHIMLQNASSCFLPWRGSCIAHTGSPNGSHATSSCQQDTSEYKQPDLLLSTGPLPKQCPSLQNTKGFAISQILYIIENLLKGDTCGNRGKQYTKPIGGGLLSIIFVESLHRSK